MVDVLTHLSLGEGRFLRRAYAVAIRRVPLLHELWYRSVSESATFRALYRRGVGARVGHALAKDLKAFRPDVIVSTHPLATSGATWLRRTGRSDVPVLAFLSDFAPHAFWVYPGVEEYYVLDEHGRRSMGALAVGTSVSITAAPVAGAFHPPDAARRAAARVRYGIADGAFAVLITSGALGLGSITTAVEGAMAASPQCHVVTVCGRNERMRAALQRRFGARPQLQVLGWVEDMATLMAATDVVINDAGGVTAIEALASGRCLVMFRPLAGHGRDSAAALARAGLAVVLDRQDALTTTLRAWCAEPSRMRLMQLRAASHTGTRNLERTAQSVLRHADRGRRMAGLAGQVSPADHDGGGG
jgi:diacylglycerol O-acyltransferase